MSISKPSLFIEKAIERPRTRKAFDDHVAFFDPSDLVYRKKDAGKKLQFPFILSLAEHRHGDGPDPDAGDLAAEEPTRYLELFKATLREETWTPGKDVTALTCVAEHDKGPRAHGLFIGNTNVALVTLADRPGSVEHGFNGEAARQVASLMINGDQWLYTE